MSHCTKCGQELIEGQEHVCPDLEDEPIITITAPAPEEENEKKKGRKRKKNSKAKEKKEITETAEAIVIKIDEETTEETAPTETAEPEVTAEPEETTEPEKDTEPTENSDSLITIMKPPADSDETKKKDRKIGKKKDKKPKQEKDKEEKKEKDAKPTAEEIKAKIKDLSDDKLLRIVAALLIGALVLLVLFYFVVAPYSRNAGPREKKSKTPTSSTTKTTKKSKENKTTEKTEEVNYEEIQLFDYIDVEFQGIDGYGTAEVTQSDEYDGFTVELDKDEDLSNGDKVNLTINMTAGQLDEFKEKYNAIPKSYEKTVTVKDLSKYIRSVNDLTKENWNRLRDFSYDFYTGTWWRPSEDPKSVDYEGSYLLINKDDPSENRVILVYRILMNNHMQGFNKDTEYFWYMGFCNVSNNFEDIDELDYYRTDDVIDIFGPNFVWEYKGYYTLDALRKGLSDPDFEIVEENF